MRKIVRGKYEVIVKGFPAILAIAHGKTIFSSHYSGRRCEEC